MIFILGLPRSRTAWLTEFLKTDKCKTSHEESLRHDSLESLYQSGFDVICDTGLILIWKELKGTVILIERSVQEVEDSLNEMGFPLMHNFLEMINDNIQEAKKCCLCIKYEDLKKEEICKDLFEMVTQEKFDHDRWVELDSKIIECDMNKLVDEIKEHPNNFLQKMYGKEG